jgi:hypothetical protein
MRSKSLSRGGKPGGSSSFFMYCAPFRSEIDGGAATPLLRLTPGWPNE